MTAVAAGVAVVPAWAAQSWQRTISWPLLALTVLPFLLNATRLPFEIEFLRSVSVATLALLVVVALQLTTTVRMTPGFAVWFSVIATLGTAGIWTFCSWLSAEYLGTAFFETNTELMLFLLTTFIAGLAAAGVFTWYFRRRLRANVQKRATNRGIT